MGDMLDMTDAQGIAAATYGHEARETMWRMHGEIPCAVSAHAEPSDVDAVEVDLIPDHDLIK